MNNDTEAVQDMVESVEQLAKRVEYSFLDRLLPDPEASETGDDFVPRQVFSGHYVPVKPTPIPDPEYVAHSYTLFKELGFSDELANDDVFKRIFSADLSNVPDAMRKTGWATGYALSIYGSEYVTQCPFQTGNGYGDGRALSVFELVANGQRWEMQLKGAGPTPYCRGGDGRAVLRSSVREFLAQEHMHALGVPTSRSLCLYTSHRETVARPWYREGSSSFDPDVMVANPVAISTRVAPSFLRVGQLELFGRRARKREHGNALNELEMIVQHLIEREYASEIDSAKPIYEQVIELARAFRDRLTYLVAQWIRVGYCQGNFNSDNCAGGGFTLDYGPFGFCEQFDPFFQPWTGGGRHFSFLNQPAAARANFQMFCIALTPLLEAHPKAQAELEAINGEFPAAMQEKLDAMWASKLGLTRFDSDLFVQLVGLMKQTPVDFTILFRELSAIPENVQALSVSFYTELDAEQEKAWESWFKNWRERVLAEQDIATASKHMRRVNPKYVWREWLVKPAYERAMQGDYTLVRELQTVMNKPYDEQSQAIEKAYYSKKPTEFFKLGGVAHYSCSS